MSVMSMTGFGRAAGRAEWGSWIWEARSVNGKGLDLRISLPSGLDDLETTIRDKAAALFRRGNIQISLKIELNTSAATLSVNQTALHAVMDAYAGAEGAPATGAALAQLMTIKGVVEAKTISSSPVFEADTARQSILEGADQVFKQLYDVRKSEGAALYSILSGHMSEIEALVQQCFKFSAQQSVNIAEKLRARLVEIDVSNLVHDERVAAEILILATKADISEELDRLVAHVKAGQSLLESDGAKGRELGFLAQEFNREANTLCAKSASIDLTNAGLALKSVIDQLKEQAANVE